MKPLPQQISAGDRPTGLTGTPIAAESARDGGRSEQLADGAVHALGLALAIIGGGILLILASRSPAAFVVPSTAVYAASLIVALGFSAAYNMWPASPTKRRLRSYDQAAIFLLIGGTFTGILWRAADHPATILGLAAIWIVALCGVFLKLRLPGRFERLSIAAYLILGWSGLAFIPVVAASLPAAALWLVVAGGLFYSIGVVFHVRRRFRFQTAVWHVFVLAAAICHYVAIVNCVA